MGKKEWSIVDGYRPAANKGEATDYRGHECILILNRTEKDANCIIDIYFEDRPPIKGIKYVAKAERINTIYTHDEKFLAHTGLEIMQQYSMHITSDVEIVVQYGRMDINQDNLAYMVTLGYGE